MRVIDEKLLATVRQGPLCEWCGKPAKGVMDAHHAVSTKGAGRLDIACNLMCVHRTCHAKLDDAASRECCIGIIAEREGVSASDVEAVVAFFKRLPKSATKQQIIRDVQELDFKAFTLAVKTLEAMPDQSPASRPLTKRKPRSRGKDRRGS